MTKRRATTVYLDEYQLDGLERLKRLRVRSVSHLVGEAVDNYLSVELEMDRHDYLRDRAARHDAQLLASFKPRPFRVPLDEPLW